MDNSAYNIGEKGLVFIIILNLYSLLGSMDFIFVNIELKNLILVDQKISKQTYHDFNAFFYEYCSTALLCIVISE